VESKTSADNISQAPVVHLAHLDDVWFQVAGTLCNLECKHCFISCSPHNRSFGMLSLDKVRCRLDESVRLGAREYYFTGGEPFLNPQMTDILIMALDYGPVTVLTNGTVLKDDWLERLADAEARSRYSLEFRVSLDGWSPETNDPIRGPGTFARAMRGVRKLVEAGFLPIVTVTQLDDTVTSDELYEQFVEVLKQQGYSRPRIKILPALRLGAEISRSRAYLAQERVTSDMLAGYDVAKLICNHSRIVTDKGVYVCPILIEAEDARLGDDLTQAHKPFALRYQACYTCWLYGAICSNPSAGAVEA